MNELLWNRTNGNNNTSKFITILLSIIFVCTITFFVGYEAANELHDCTGESCPICQELHIAEVLTNQLEGAVQFSIAAFLPVIITGLFIDRFFCLIRRRTLIFDKVRLDD